MENIKFKSIFLITVILMLFSSINISKVLAREIDVPVYMTVKDENGQILKGGEKYTHLNPGDKVIVTAYATDSKALYWSNNAGWMQRKGFMPNNKGMAILSYGFDITQANQFIRSKNPTEMVVTIPEFVPGSVHTLQLQAVSAVDRYIDDEGNNYVSYYGIKLILEQPKIQTKITETISKINDKTLQLKASVENGSFSKFEYAWDNGSKITDSNNPAIVNIPVFAPATKHILRATAYTTNGKTDTKTYEVIMPEKLTGDISVIYNGINLSNNSYTNVNSGRKLTVRGIPNENFKEISGKWQIGNNSFSEFVFAGNEYVLDIPGAKGQTVVLTVNGILKDGTKINSKTFNFKIPGEVVPEVTGTVQGEGLNENKDNIKNIGDKIVIYGNPQNAFLKLSYSWDNGTIYDLNGGYGSIKVPNFDEGTRHKLVVKGTLTNGKVVSEKVYYIYIPKNEIVDPELIDGDIYVKFEEKTLRDNGSYLVNKDDEIIFNGRPENYIDKIIYTWNDGKEFTISVPFGKTYVPNIFNETQILKVYGILVDGTKTKTKTYKFDRETYSEEELIIEPWMKEDYDAEGLLISLRNDSEEEKANKNFYKLDEDIIYYIDYKNCGRAIDSEINIVFNIPLEFRVKDSDDGRVSYSNQTITWTFANGLDEDQAGTKRVVISYKELTRSSFDYEYIYPEAKIYEENRVEDTSAVINYIYLSDSTIISDRHYPYMFGDEGKTTFRPNDTITRAEGAIVLTRIFGIRTSGITVTNKFSDIGDTYLEAQRAIMAASKVGIIDGYEDGTYRPNEKMTRAEFMKIIASYIEFLGEDENIDGLEIKEGATIKVYKNSYNRNHWAIPYATLLARLNMTSVSESEKDLRLEDDITRAEVAQLINFYAFRAPAKITSRTEIQFSDVSRRHKLFADIVEATREAHDYTITYDGKEIAE